ncbi:MAG: alpha/beta hydrolase-fold protein [Planctomycetaceae bacterium]
MAARIPFCRYIPLCLALALSALQPALPAQAESPIEGFVQRTMRDETGEHKYAVFVPPGYTPEKKWPVILYLHGFSSRGTDNTLQLMGGLAPQVRAKGENFPFLVVFPQCEDLESQIFEAWTAESSDGKRAIRILDEVEKEFSVDKRREVLTGWSMGGFGAWSLAAAYPARWSAVAIVAAGGEPDVAAKVHAPVWAFVGTKDPFMKVETNRRMIEAVNGSGGTGHLTILPNAGHNIGHVVYAEDALYEWMLNPKSVPKGESVVRNATRKASPVEMGADMEMPFVPSVEVPQSVYFRLDNESLEALAYFLPGMIPEDALSGWVADKTQTTFAAGLRFDVNLSGINYRGEVERVRVKTRKDGWINVQIGMRNMLMEIGTTRVSGMMTSTTAGSMQIVIGHERPVWLTIDVRPRIEDRRLRLEAGPVQFEIPDDNFYVTSPSYVSSRGMPFLRRRVAASISDKLVTGAYSKKGEIEAQVLASVPALLEKMHSRLDENLDTPRYLNDWPMPAYMPRYKMWPTEMVVNEAGISVILGMTISRPGFDTKPPSVRRIERPALNLASLSKSKGLIFGKSEALIEGLTTAILETRAASADIHDLITIPELAALAERDELVEIIPDLARYGENLQTRARIKMLAPVSLVPVDTALLGDSAADSKRALEVRIPRMQIAVDIRTDRSQQKWTPCAEFDLKIAQRLSISLDKSDFAVRKIATNLLGDLKISAVARFHDDYEPMQSSLDSGRVAAIFRAGWDAHADQMLQTRTIPELAFGSAKFRATEVQFADSYLTTRFLPARTRIVNKSDQPLEYELRGPFSQWGGPYTLAPGEFHEFRVPYDLTFRQNTGENEVKYTLPLGSSSTYRSLADGKSPELLQAKKPTGDASRN